MRAAPPLNHTSSPKQLLKLLSQKPLSTGMILNRFKSYEVRPLISTFCKLRKEGKIDFVGFYPCPITGKNSPYYLTYSNSLPL